VDCGGVCRCQQAAVLVQVQTDCPPSRSRIQVTVTDIYIYTDILTEYTHHAVARDVDALHPLRRQLAQHRHQRGVAARVLGAEVARRVVAGDLGGWVGGFGGFGGFGGWWG
jgi:hypothetical protein